MKTMTTFKMMFFIVTAFTFFSCKQANDNNDSMSVDSTTTTTETDTMNNMPDTITTPAPGTPVDTLRNDTLSKKPSNR